jgi:hypothetical protein
MIKNLQLFFKSKILFKAITLTSIFIYIVITLEISRFSLGDGYSKLSLLMFGGAFIIFFFIIYMIILQVFEVHVPHLAFKKKHIKKNPDIFYGQMIIVLETILFTWIFMTFLLGINVNHIDIKINDLKLKNISGDKADIVINNNIILPKQKIECVKNNYIKNQAFLQTFQVDGKMVYNSTCNNIIQKKDILKPDLDAFIKKYKED